MKGSPTTSLLTWVRFSSRSVLQFTPLAAPSFHRSATCWSSVQAQLVCSLLAWQGFLAPEMSSLPTLTKAA